MKGRMSIKNILVLTVLFIFSFMFLNMSLAASTAKIVVETANIRQNPSTESTILKQVGLNEEVSIIETQDEWIKVQSGNVTGYIKTELLDIENDNTDETSSVEETVTDDDSLVEGHTEETSKVIEETSEETTEIETENETNIIDENKTSDKDLGAYYAIGTINLKMVPLINATNINTLENETKVNVVKFSNHWAYVEYNGQRGWIYEENLKSQAQLDAEIAEAQRLAEIEAERARMEALLNAPVIKTVFVSSQTINFREEPDIESSVIKTFSLNDELAIIGTDVEGWYQIRDGENIGYVSTQYVSDTKTVVRTQETTSSRSSVNRTTSQSTTTATNTTTSTPTVSANSSIVSIAQQYLGIPYKYGGSSPSTGFDCSGFTQYVYAQAGISIPRTTYDQQNVGTAVSLENAQPGDLVVYYSGHAAIYVGNGQVIHSPYTGKTIEYASISNAGKGSYTIRRIG